MFSAHRRSRCCLSETAETCSQSRALAPLLERAKSSGQVQVHTEHSTRKQNPEKSFDYHLRESLELQVWAMLLGILHGRHHIERL